MVSALNDEINMTGLAAGKKNIETVTVISIRNTVGVSASGRFNVKIDGTKKRYEMTCSGRVYTLVVSLITDG